MIHLYLTPRVQAAARGVDPNIDLAAVHAAAEVAVAEVLRAVADLPAEEIRRTADAIEYRIDPARAA
jgi:hypothetical protein